MDKFILIYRDRTCFPVFYDVIKTSLYHMITALDCDVIRTSENPGKRCLSLQSLILTLVVKQLLGAYLQNRLVDFLDFLQAN